MLPALDMVSLSNRLVFADSVPSAEFSTEISDMNMTVRSVAYRDKAMVTAAAETISSTVAPRDKSHTGRAKP